MIEITEFLYCTNTFGANSWFACFKILVFCVGGLAFKYSSFETTCISMRSWSRTVL